MLRAKMRVRTHGDHENLSNRIHDGRTEPRKTNTPHKIIRSKFSRDSADSSKEFQKEFIIAMDDLIPASERGAQ